MYRLIHGKSGECPTKGVIEYLLISLFWKGNENMANDEIRNSQANSALLPFLHETNLVTES
jgi:hypothetical protein